MLKKPCLKVWSLQNHFGDWKYPPTTTPPLLNFSKNSYVLVWPSVTYLNHIIILVIMRIAMMTRLSNKTMTTFSDLTNYLECDYILSIYFGQENKWIYFGVWSRSCRLLLPKGAEMCPLYKSLCLRKYSKKTNTNTNTLCKSLTEEMFTSIINYRINIEYQIFFASFCLPF